MFLFTGMVWVVDSRSDYKTVLINFKFTNPHWIFDENEFNEITRKIKAIYNPKGLTIDDAFIWMLNNHPYGKNQTKAKTFKCRNHLELLNTIIDTESEGTYDD